MNNNNNNINTNNKTDHWQQQGLTFLTGNISKHVFQALWINKENIFVEYEQTHKALIVKMK